LIGTFAVLIVLIQGASSVVQARREDRAYTKQARREDEIEDRRHKREDILERLRREHEDAVEVRRSEREQQLFSFWTEREKQLDTRRSNRENRLDEMTASSVESVNNVLQIVYGTFDERRKAEAEGRQVAESFSKGLKDLTETIDKLNGKIRDLEGFADDIRRTVENERRAIEQRAIRLTKTTPRHLFRERGAELAELAREHDAFVAKQGLADVPSKDGAHFSVYVSYIRGIAAHYANDPKRATAQLERVAVDASVQPGEEPTHCNKRRAVAYYFLGVTESNFGAYLRAIEAFQRAIDLESSPKDVLSRLVAAEAAAFESRAVDANAYLEQVDNILLEVRQQHEAAKRPLPSSFKRQGIRAALIRANIAIAGGRDSWDAAERLLRSVSEPHEYYASATLGQILERRNPGSTEARSCFEQAYLAIRDLGHLHAVSEVRSKILLLQVAGMSARYTHGYTAMAEEHLAEAESLVASLPERDGQFCTVFSILAKRNVDRSSILTEIEALRRGSVLSEA
jgi:tetratricopeptide (TPR) repeat protein